MSTSRKEAEARIKELEKEISKEPRFSKRWVFLATTINRYSKQIGKPAKYTW